MFPVSFTVPFVRVAFCISISLNFKVARPWLATDLEVCAVVLKTTDTDSAQNQAQIFKLFVKNYLWDFIVQVLKPCSEVSPMKIIATDNRGYLNT